MSSTESLIETLSLFLGKDRVLLDGPELERCSWDALSDGRIHPHRRPKAVSPLCMVLPKSTEEVRRLVLLANEEKVPIVPYGGGSGLMGGALSVVPGMVLDLSLMNRVLKIDRESRTARVEAGIVLEDLQQALSPEGLILGHDPWTVPVATVGGTISTNSLGYSGGKYGSMGDQVLGLEVVLPNGETLRTRGVPKSSTGPALKHLFIGGEGCFGVITEATIKVFPAPEKRALFAFRFESFKRGFRVIQRIFDLGISPSVLDLGDDPSKFPGEATLYLALEGTKDIVGAEQGIVLAVCKEEKGRRLPQGQAEEFYRDRHVIAQNFLLNRLRRRERSPERIRRDWIHVALPASQVLEFRRRAMEVTDRFQVRLQESGLWTRPELFSMRLSVERKNVDEGQKFLEDAVESLLRLVQEMGGSMEYCHGVGIKLAPLMEGEVGYGLDVLRMLKKALDPNGIMNPGKLGL